MLNTFKKIYITGGNGLVGRNLRENETLAKSVIVAPTHAELDLTDYNAVYSFIKDEKPDLIIHTAGLVGGIAANMADPYGFFTNNALMGINLVRAAKELGVKNFLNLSSSCFYPCGAVNPLKEDVILTGAFEKTNEGYGLAKASILKMCQYLTEQFEGYNYKTIIPCNLYGRYDKFSPQKSHLIPAIIRKVAEAKKNGDKTIEIWGDGESRREFMYTGDFAQIIPQVLEKFDEIPNIMNIGLGHDFTINEYYQMIAKVIGIDVEFTHDLTKPSGMRQKLLDISRQKEFGFESKFSLEEGIKRTYEYYLNEYKGE